MGLVTMTNAALYCITKPKHFSYMSQCHLLSFLLPKKRKSISMCTNRIAVQVASVSVCHNVISHSVLSDIPSCLCLTVICDWSVPLHPAYQAE